METSIPAEERETTVVVGELDGMVRIQTSIRRHITKLRKHSRATEVRTVRVGSSEEVTFEIPAAEWNPVTGIKRKGHTLTEEQRAAAAVRLAKAREGAGK